MASNRQAMAAFLAAVAASALIWALSPFVTGHAEPWDADGPYYVIALLVTGLVTGGLLPRPVWAHYLGALAGQLAYEVIFLEAGPLIVLGVAFLLGYSLIFLAAASLAGFAHLRIAAKPPEA